MAHANPIPRHLTVTASSPEALDVRSPHADQSVAESALTGSIAKSRPVKHSPAATAVRPKVLQVLEATAAGTAGHVADLLLRIDLAAFDVSFAFSPLRADERFAKNLQTIRNRGVHTYEIPMQRNIRPGADIRALRDLYRLIKERQFDIVHGHSSKAGFLARLAAKLANPEIVTVYSPHAISIAVNRKYWYLERFAGLLTNVVLGVSQSEHDELKTYQFVPPAKLRYATAGIDIPAFVGSFGGSDFRRRIGVPNDAIFIGSAGRITAQKDPATFLKAAAELLKRGVKAHFAWAGDGDLKAASHSLARSLGIEQNVTLLGYCPDLRPFLDAIDIFALTSLYESFGYVTCEAMAMGKPVVATNVSGSNELVRHGETGYLVRVSDVQGLALAFQDLAADWQLRSRMGAAGSARAQKYYDLGRMVRDIEEVYQELFCAAREARSERSPTRVVALEANRS